MSNSRDSKENAPETPALFYSDEYLQAILRDTRVIAMVGASANWKRPSYFAMKYLQKKGFRVIPVNPGQAGKSILGETVYADLKSIPVQVDMVDCFRPSEAIPAIAMDAVEIGAKVLWMQLGIRSEEGARIAEETGLRVVMDRCPKIEYGRLHGELGWAGINSGIISSQRARSPRTSGPADKGSDRGGKPTGYGFETRAIHAGAAPDPVTGARATPIFQTTSYVFDDVDHAASLFNLQDFGNIYARINNPTVSVLEERVANLEGGRGAVACASGHAAQFLAFFTIMEPGDEFVASRNLYGGSITQFGQSFRKFGWTCHFVDPRDPDNFRKALTPRCKAIFIENLANPGGVVVDIEAVATVAKEAGIPLMVDNTLASPYLCNPFDWGADIVLHSMTKFLGGHGNSMGGVVVESGRFDWAQNDKFPSLTQPSPAYHGLVFHETFGDFGFTMKVRAEGLRDMGPALSPFNAFMILTGIETLGLRMERHVRNAQAVAEFLEAHPKVAWVSYAGLESSPFRDLARKYLPKGPGSVFTFGVKGGYEAGVRLVESVQVLSHLANVGDTRSLVIHPASTTHRQLTEEQQVTAGAGPDVVRLSIGLETAADIIDDLNRALDQA